MPFINTKVNVKITEEQERLLKGELGKAISLIGGKSESWLMLNFEDNNRMYFKGKNEYGIAFIEVKIYGRATAAEYENFRKRSARESDRKFNDGISFAVNQILAILEFFQDIFAFIRDRNRMA